MTRLIDADELTAQIVGMAMDKAVVYGNAAIKGSKEIFALAMVTQAPTIDAVPVIRCEQCAHYTIFPVGPLCLEFGQIVEPSDYCSRAEPKE